MTRDFQPVAARALPDVLAARLDSLAVDRQALRVAIDGPRCADPVGVAGTLTAPLRRLGRAVHVVDAEFFLRDASTRLEHGREDVDAFLSWLDAPALRREVLDPLAPGGSGRYLPTLRDPATNRATRAPARGATAGSVLIVAGELLLGCGLPFDVTLHLAMSAATRDRRTPPERAWTLPAFTRYDTQVRPLHVADIVISLNDPERPAIG